MTTPADLMEPVRALAVGFARNRERVLASKAWTVYHLVEIGSQQTIRVASSKLDQMVADHGGDRDALAIMMREVAALVRGAVTDEVLPEEPAFPRTPISGWSRGGRWNARHHMWE